MAQNRRPSTLREARSVKALVDILVEKQVSPNKISVSSIGFALLSFLSFSIIGLIQGAPLSRFFYFIALLGIAGRLLCNLLDGMVAFGEKTHPAKGELYNDLPDRISDILILAGAGISIREDHALFLSGTTLGLVAALAAVLTAYIRYLGASTGAGQIFLGPMAKQHRMYLLAAVSLSSIFIEQDYSQFSIALWIVVVGCLMTCIRRVNRIVGSISSSRDESLKA